MKVLGFIYGVTITAVTMLSSCQKQELEPGKNSVDAQAKIGNNANVENSCRLVYFDWPTTSSWQFHYNDKGLADQWTISDAYGSVVNTMTYDESNRLVQSNEVFYGSNYVYQFNYTGKRLTHFTRTSVEYPDEVVDIHLTYSKNGQLIRQDMSDDTHVLMYYDAMGNCTRTDVYFGNYLFFSDTYTFKLPARNPELNIPGIEIGFPYYGTAGITNKRWFTSNLTVIYDGGVEYVINDYDASKTVINKGILNFPSTADYYDPISQLPINMTFEYGNCNGLNEAATIVGTKDKRTEQTGTLPIMRSLLLRSSVKTMKEQIKETVRQLKVSK